MSVKLCIDHELKSFKVQSSTMLICWTLIDMHTNLVLSWLFGNAAFSGFILLPFCFVLNASYLNLAIHNISIQHAGQPLPNVTSYQTLTIATRLSRNYLSMSPLFQYVRCQTSITIKVAFLRLYICSYLQFVYQLLSFLAAILNSVMA